MQDALDGMEPPEDVSDPPTTHAAGSSSESDEVAALRARVAALETQLTAVCDSRAQYYDFLLESAGRAVELAGSVVVQERGIIGCIWRAQEAGTAERHSLCR